MSGNSVVKADRTKPRAAKTAAGCRTKTARPQTDQPKVDRRARRTRDALGDALLDLMPEKSFDDITVQQVLDRAGVGRSTF
jgi:AcrR family transcriptional regulator